MRVLVRHTGFFSRRLNGLYLRPLESDGWNEGHGDF